MGINKRRQRHGRPLQAPIISKKFPAYQSKSEIFENYFNTSTKILKTQWEKKLKNVTFHIENVPPEEIYNTKQTEVPKGSCQQKNHQQTKITIYRIPILTNTEQKDLQQTIHNTVIEQIAKHLQTTPEQVDKNYNN